MKKIFTLVAMLTMAVVGASADEVTYAIAADETHTAGSTVSVTSTDASNPEEVITLTFGFDGGADFKAGKANSSLSDYGFEAFTEGNGENGKPDAGTTYILKPKYDGVITVGVVLNANKAFYVLENDEALADYNGITKDEKYYGVFDFTVKGGNTYKVYCAGSKLGFYGFTYEYEADNVDNTFQFVDLDGNVIPNGAELEFDEAEVDPFGNAQVVLPLKVKANDLSKQVQLKGNISRLDNGNLQVCFPVNCINYNKTGDFDNGYSLLTSSPWGMQTEWIPSGYGECHATFQLFAGQLLFGSVFSVTGEGAKISVKFVYRDPAAVNGVKESRATVDTSYDATGRMLRQGTKGLNIQRMSDGTVRKVMVK